YRGARPEQPHCRHPLHRSAEMAGGLPGGPRRGVRLPHHGRAAAGDDAVLSRGHRGVAEPSVAARSKAGAMSSPVEREPLLRVEGLSKAFGGIRAVDGLNLSVAAGELRCLIGPNGAGKSTLFSLLAGIHEPDAGRILFKGEDITDLSPFRRVRKGICLKFQTTRIYRGLTVGENLIIARGKRAGSGANGRLEWALGALGLAGE